MGGADDGTVTPASTWTDASLRSQASTDDRADGLPERAPPPGPLHSGSSWKRRRTLWSNAAPSISNLTSELRNDVLFLDTTAAPKPTGFFRFFRSVATTTPSTVTQIDGIPVNMADDAALPTNAAQVLPIATIPSSPSRWHLRAHEELCLVLAKSTSSTEFVSKKAWYLAPGLIGRERGHNVHIVTHDGSMDAVQAEILVEGDDYLIQNHSSSTAGTFLCLSTATRYHPQRDGFRLRMGDTFFVGNAARVVITALGTTSRTTSSIHRESRAKPRLSRRLTDTKELQDAARHVHHPPHPRKSVRFAEIHMSNGNERALPAEDGSLFLLGSRYRRTMNLDPCVYEPRKPAVLACQVFLLGDAAAQAQDPIELELRPKQKYTIGSSPSCDIHIDRADCIRPVHARIVFDGHFFVLQDLSFEANPKLKTRVAITRPTRIARGDILLFGQCAMMVVSARRAFRNRDPDLKEIALKCQVLRISKRKARRREKYLTIAFRNTTSDMIAVGKGATCEGRIFASSLGVEQLVVQLEHGICSLTPRFAGLGQGLYFLLGRNSLLHETTYNDDTVRHTSKALMLVENMIFRCGSSEVEVAYIKTENPLEAMLHAEETHENLQLLKMMPWLHQIRSDRHTMENIARHATRLEIEAGETIYNKGDAANFVFVIIQGIVQISTIQHEQLREVPGNNLIIHREQERNFVLETLTFGAFFGEICLYQEADASGEYVETAKARSDCLLLVLAREDIVGYLEPYVDIFQPHLLHEHYRTLLQQLRFCVPWCVTVPYHDLRMIAAKAEWVEFEAGAVVLRPDGFYWAKRKRFGLLFLQTGRVECTDDIKDDDGGTPEDDPFENPAAWSVAKPIMLLPDVPVPTTLANIRASTRLECLFIDISVFQHLMKESEARLISVPTAMGKTDSIARTSSVTSRRSSVRRSSYASTSCRMRHSQVITASLHATTEDESESLLEDADLEDLNDQSQKWRRKKRNKILLEKTIVETQQNTDWPNALVLYVLSGANRGDVHVVRNVSTVGRVMSEADIELNDCYVSPMQAVIEHREGHYWLYDTFSDWGTYVRMEENQSVQVFPGDIFLAGEVEITCMGTFPERQKTGICCIQ